MCQEDGYLKELVRYIHLNPLRVGIVANLRGLNTYRYCGHSALMGKREFEWQETGYVLSYFGKRVSNARKSYYEYVKEDIRQGRRPEFVLQVLKEADEKFGRYYESKQLGYNLQDVEERVCKIVDLSVGDIYSKSREKAKAEARGLFCYWSVRELGYSMLEIPR